jgi:hypothetical protein
MLRYQKDNIQVAETALNFSKLGEVNIKRLGDVPYYMFKIKDKYILRQDKTLCCSNDAKFCGDCYDHLSKFILFGWENYESKSLNEVNNNGFYDGRVCEKSDVGKELYDQGTLLICPPLEGLAMENRAFSYPNKHFSFGITQKNTDKATIDFVNELKLFRFQMDPIIDYTIHGRKPIVHIPRWENSFVLNYGTTIQAHSLF